MKRLVPSLVGMLLALGLLAGASSATHSNGQGPDFDKVDGTGKQQLTTPFGVFPAQLHVNAKRDPSGVGAQGHFYTDILSSPFGEVVLSGVVDGLTVNGNNAFVCGTITESTLPAIVPPGAKTLGRHVDNGEGSKATNPDQGAGIIIGGTTTPPMTVCPAITIPTRPVEQGNYIVHDGQ